MKALQLIRELSHRFYRTQPESILEPLLQLQVLLQELEQVVPLELPEQVELAENCEGFIASTKSIFAGLKSKKLFYIPEFIK